jgi:putative oxidoreductase
MEHTKEIDVYRRLSQYDDLVPVILRVGVGLTFFFAGLAKVLGGVDGLTGFFGSLGIPLPGLMAPFISYLELFGGLAILLGLLTRPIAALLIGDMLVAMLLVKIPAWMSAENGMAGGFAETRIEFLLALVCVALIITGAGAYSLDAKLFGREAVARRAEPRVSPAR